MITVGYIGSEAYDLILYLGRILTKLNYRILIVDLSDTEALTYVIKHGMGLDSRKVMIHYRDIDYVRRIPLQEELEEYRDGVVLISYGFHCSEQQLQNCDIINVIFDTSLHIQNRVFQLIKDIPICHDKVQFLIRDIISSDDLEYVMNSFGFLLNKQRLNYLYLDHRDYENAVACQTSKMIQLSKISFGMKKYLLHQIQFIIPDLKPVYMKKAIAAARKGA